MAQQIVSTYDKVKKQCRPCWTWPLIIGTYQVKWKQDIPSLEWEQDQFILDEYNSPRMCFDNIKKVQSLARKEFQHKEVIEYHWMNARNDYDVHIWDYFWMNLYLVEKALNMNIPKEILQQD